MEYGISVPANLLATKDAGQKIIDSGHHYCFGSACRTWNLTFPLCVPLTMKWIE